MLDTLAPFAGILGLIGFAGRDLATRAAPPVTKEGPASCRAFPFSGGPAMDRLQIEVAAEAGRVAQLYCADFTSRCLASMPCSLPMPRARCIVSSSSNTPTAATTIATSGDAAIGSTFTSLM